MSDRGYLIVVEKTPHNYSAYSPDLPGCVSTGKTVDDVLANMRDAIVFHLEGLRADGEPIPPPSSRAEYIKV